MNFFYKETGKKKVHYFQNGKASSFNSFDVSKKFDVQTPTTPSPTRLFRFTVLTTDLLALNIILIILLNFLNVPKYENNQALIINANISWLISSYLTALYFGKERFIARTIQASLLYIALTLLLIFLFKSNFRSLLDL